MELLSNLTGSLSWPALIVILALIFRPEIATKIGELEGIKSRFGSFDFRRRVESARQTLDASSEIKRIGTVLETGETVETLEPVIGVNEPTPTEQPKDAGPFNLTGEDMWREITILARHYPAFAVREAAKQLDRSISRLAVPIGRPIYMPAAVNKLADEGRIPLDLAPVILDLLELRDLTQKSPNVSVSTKDAVQYAETVHQLTEVLDSLPRATLQ